LDPFFISTNPIRDGRLVAAARLGGSAEGRLYCGLTDITEHPTREGKIYCCAVACIHAQRLASRHDSPYPKGMNLPESSVVGPFLTRRGAGKFNGYEWTFHADVLSGRLRSYLYIDDVAGRTGGFGGGGAGILGEEALQEVTKGLILTMGQLNSGQDVSNDRQRPPRAVDGAVTGPVAKVLIQLSDGSAQEATLLPSGDPNLQYFVLVYPSRMSISRVVAVDSSGHELDRK